MNLLIADSGSTKTDWSLLQDGDVVIYFGAGDIGRVAKDMATEHGVTQ